MPKISVIMSVFKEPIEWLRQSIDSILNQTFKDFEFIIICDNPEYEEGINLLKEYSQKDDRIVIVFNEKNIGLTKSLNKGLAIAKGEYIARMDADDITLPDRLEKQINYLDQHPDVTVVHSYIELFGNNLKSKIKTSPLNNDAIIKTLMYSNCIHHPAVMFIKSVFDEHNIRYNESFRRSQDYDLWLQAALCDCKFATIPEVLLRYRLSESQITSNHRSEQIKDHNNIMKTFFRNYCDRCNFTLPEKLTRNYVQEFCTIYDMSGNVGIMNKTLGFQLYFTLPRTLTKLFLIIPDACLLKFSVKQIIILFASYIYPKRWSALDMKHALYK